MGVYTMWVGAVAYLCCRWGKWAWEQYGKDGLWKRRTALVAAPDLRVPPEEAPTEVQAAEVGEAPVDEAPSESDERDDEERDDDERDD